MPTLGANIAGKYSPAILDKTRRQDFPTETVYSFALDTRFPDHDP